MASYGSALWLSGNYDKAIEIAIKALNLYRDLQEYGMIASSYMKDFFNKFSHRIALSMGSPVAFVLAILVIVVWGFFGPPTHYSET